MSSEDKIYTTQISEEQSLLVTNLIQSKGSEELKQALSNGYKIWVEVCCELNHFYGVFECREGASTEESDRVHKELHKLFFDEQLGFYIEDLRGYPPIKITPVSNFEDLIKTALAKPVLEACWDASSTEGGER